MQRDTFLRKVQAATKLPPAGRVDALDEIFNYFKVEIAESHLRGQKMAYEQAAAGQPTKKAVPPTGKQRKQMISDILRLMRFTVSDVTRCKLQELGESLLFEWQDLDARTVRKQIASLTE